MFKILTKYTLSHEYNKVYTDIAYDGCKAYLCTHDKRIVVMDQAFSIVKSISTYYSYHTLCYDSTNNCFWAASPESPGVLFKSSDLSQIDAELVLSLQEENAVLIDSLIFDTSSKQLLAAKGNNIYVIGKTGELLPFLELRELEEKPLKICILQDRLLCLCLCRKELHLIQFSRADGKLLNDEVLSNISGAKSMIMTQNNPMHPDFTLLLLAEEQDLSPCLIELKPEPSDVQMQQLGRLCLRCPFWIGSPNNCNFNRQRNCGPDYCNSNQNNFNSSCSLISPVSDCCDTSGGGFNSRGCAPGCCDSGCCDSDCCSSGCCDSDCFPPGCHHHACTQVIESIALTETSIAHILNAEGEKLQKAIACTCNVNDLLRVNDSVLRTIIHSTQLEQILFYKLEAALRGEDCDCHPCPHPCPHPCHAQDMDQGTE